MTAISVSERLLEMAAFYTPLALTVTVRKKRHTKNGTYEKQKSSKSDDFEDFWYAVRDSNPRPSGP